MKEMESETKQKTNDELVSVIQRILAEDQMDGHSRAPACLAELVSLEKDFVGTDCEDMYWDSVSREHLHIGQRAGQRGDAEQALSSIKLALEAARKVKADFYRGSDWLAYLDATVAYFESAPERLRALSSQCSLNRAVVERLMRGLRERGAPDYQKDY